MQRVEEKTDFKYFMDKWLEEYKECLRAFLEADDENNNEYLVEALNTRESIRKNNDKYNQITSSELSDIERGINAGNEDIYSYDKQRIPGLLGPSLNGALGFDINAEYLSHLTLFEKIKYEALLYYIQVQLHQEYLAITLTYYNTNNNDGELNNQLKIQKAYSEFKEKVLFPQMKLILEKHLHSRLTNEKQKRLQKPVSTKNLDKIKRDIFTPVKEIILDKNAGHKRGFDDEVIAKRPLPKRRNTTTNVAENTKPAGFFARHPWAKWALIGLGVGVAVAGFVMLGILTFGAMPAVVGAAAAIGGAVGLGGAAAIGVGFTVIGAGAAVAGGVVLGVAGKIKSEVTNSATVTPVTETPVTETPVTETPVTETPVTETPVTETPVTETPVTETPVTPKQGQGQNKSKSDPRLFANNNKQRSTSDTLTNEIDDTTPRSGPGPGSG